MNYIVDGKTILPYIQTWIYLQLTNMTKLQWTDILNQNKIRPVFYLLL